LIVTDLRVAQFVADRVGYQCFYPPFTCMGLERDGRIVAGVVFNCFTGNDIAVTVAGERGAFTRHFIKEVGRYVYETNGCGRMSITTEQPKIVALAKRLGAQTEGRKRHLFGKGRHGVVLGILKEEWRLNG
jgi:hypothetical protein